jgi:hypothetical protein
LNRTPPARAMRENPDLHQLKRQAKELVEAYRASLPDAVAEVIARRMLAGEVEPHLEPDDFSGRTVANNCCGVVRAHCPPTSSVWRSSMLTGRPMTPVGSGCSGGPSPVMKTTPPSSKQNVARASG